MTTVQSYVQETLESTRYAGVVEHAFDSAVRARMSPGVLTQFMLYAAIVAGSTGALSEVLGDVQRAAGATERLLELLDAKPAIVGGTFRLPDPSSQTSSGSTVAFDQVDFSYPSELTLDSLRATIGFVSQESVVFSDDVASNLRFGKPDASDDELIAAARAAQAHEFIERLPQGYATPLGEKGVRLSGGQRQRLSIARALLKNPPLLLLDEATSALDAEAERKVQLALDTAMTGRTTLVIAHRLATVVSADRILVLDGGRIVESGTHNELVAAGGLYSELAALQFESPTPKSPQD